MKELAFFFLKVGTIGFGGPIALIGMMEMELVQKRQWLSIQEFQRFVAVSKLFPGPLATLVAIRIGRLRKGTWGGVLSGICLILPSFLMILALTGIVKQLESIQFLNPLWVGLSMAALALGIQATRQLAEPLFKKPEMTPKQTLVILITVATLTFYFPSAEALFIIGTGALGLLFERLTLNRRRPLEVASLLSLGIIFYSCFKASLFTFGTGIAIVPVLRTVFIDHHHWISNQDFLKGLMLGQITPGPLVIVSTYLGYMTAHLPGAIAATIGTFLPTFLLGTWVMPLVEDKILGSIKMKAFFTWLLPAVSGAILGSLVRLMLFSVLVNDQWMWGRLILSMILIAIMLRYKLGPEKIFLIGGIAAYAVS